MEFVWYSRVIITQPHSRAYKRESQKKNLLIATVDSQSIKMPHAFRVRKVFDFSMSLASNKVIMRVLYEFNIVLWRQQLMQDKTLPLHASVPVYLMRCYLYRCYEINGQRNILFQGILLFTQLYLFKIDFGSSVCVRYYFVCWP